MWLFLVLNVCFLTIFFVNVSLSVFTPYESYTKKPKLSPGIKTANWRNTPTEKNILVHHNYSHVNYQNKGNALTPQEIYESTTKKLYPVYNPEVDLKKNKNNEEETHQKIIVRVKKQLQVYEKCPQGANGQFVYSLSCNQFLNCWKGRTFVQNCAPGTLFNPDTLTCDFPEKVRCVTGPRQTVYEPSSPVYLSHNVNTRDVQPNCPKEFSGRMPNYSNCSKFVVCMEGEATSQMCPPGTLFDVNRNICDFPKIAKCFNGQNRDSSSVDFFLVDSNSNKIEEEINPNLNSNKQRNDYQFPRPTFDENCDGRRKNCRTPSSSRGVPQGNDCGPQNNCSPSGNPPTNVVGTSDFLDYQHEGKSNVQSTNFIRESGGFINYNNCNPSVGNCDPNFVKPTTYRAITSGHTTNYQGVRPFPSSKPRGVPQGNDCGPSNRNCSPSKPPISGGTSDLSDYQHGFSDQSLKPGFSRCDPNTSNCREGYSPKCNHHDVNCDVIGTSKINSKKDGRNSKGTREELSEGDRRQNEPTCPKGVTGLQPHPNDCAKFLNCANGMTFVQNCGPGTMFNPKMMICDFDYNVDCSKIQDVPDNNIGITKSKNDEEDWVTTYSYLRPDISYQKPTARPPKLPQNYNKPNLQNLETSTKDKNWPPPFPSTDTNADYVFEYYDVDMEPSLDPQNLNQQLQPSKIDCNKEGFECNSYQKRCIAKNLVCDGKTDCPNSKDEEGCIDHLGKFELRKSSRLAVIEKERWDNTTVTSCAFLCLESRNFECKSFNYRNVDNCCLLTDLNEGLSGRLIQSPSNDFYERKSSKLDCQSMFKCENNKCIEKNKICDGQNDCVNREDEKDCPAEQIGYKIKLDGGKNPWEGRLEVTAFGRTGFVCDDKFDQRTANVVCRELGYKLGASEVKGSSFFAQGFPLEKVFYMMDDVTCDGNETSIRNCVFNGWGSHDCTNQEVVGVVCKAAQETCPDNYWKCARTNECVPMAFVCDGPEDCSDGTDESEELCNAPISLRLVNGTNSSEGRLEVKYHGVWGTICDDDFNDDAGKVVCKNLGFRGTSTVKKDAYFGQGSGPIWLDQVTCFGNETKIIDQCGHWNWGEHNCDHSEDVGVICSNSDTSDIERHVKKTPLVKNFEESLGSNEGGDEDDYPIYPKVCGLRKFNLQSSSKVSDVHFRVVQGSKAKIGDFPWQAALRVKGRLHSAHWCGAVVISSKFVLTAAHCLVGYPKGAYVVVAGDYNVQIDEKTEQSAFIEDYYIHEDFRKGHKMNNDIALVKLKGRGFKLNEDVQAICLPDKNADYEVNLNCTISGFGSIESGTSAFSNELRAGVVPLQREKVCKLPHVYGPSLTEGMICAGRLDGGADSCDGDSGGPLACLDEGLYTLYGITSWGQRCGYANKPGVYVKVAHYRGWIDGKIRDNI